MGVGGLQKVKAGKKSLPKETKDYVGRVYKYAGIKYEDASYANSVAPYMNQSQETITPTLNYFNIPKEITTFASVPDSAEEKTTDKIDKDVEEVETKTKEYNFLEALQNLSKEDYSHLQPEQVAQQQTVPQVDFNQQYEQVSQFIDEPLVVQQGGSVKQDNEWLKNWYTNRVIPNKDVQGAYLEDKPIYTERLKNIPLVTKVNMIDNNPQKTGQYQGDTGKILMTPTAQPSVYTHEVNHYLNDFPSTMRTVHENVVEQNMYKKGDSRLGGNNEYYDYLRNPDEIHSRVQVLRKDAGFKPNEEVTQDKLLKYLQNYKGSDENILQLMNLTDEKGLLEMLNYMAETPKNKEKQYVAQQGGKYSENELAFLSEIAIKDNNGYWNKDNQGKVVEIDGNQITMKGVDQDLIGIGIDKKGKKTEQKTMKAGKNYNFDKAIKVIEIPLFKK